MIFCNSGPIAAGCYLGKDLVGSALDTFFRVVIDLTALGKDIELDFKFCKISIKNKNIKYSFKNDFIQNLNLPEFENKMKKSEPPTNALWKNTA